MKVGGVSMASSAPIQVVLLAVGNTQIFNLADGSTVMVVAVPTGAGTGGAGPSGGDVTSSTVPLDPPTIPGGHIAAVVVIDPIDPRDVLATDSLTLRFEPSDAAEAAPGVRIVSEDIVRALLSDGSSEVVVRPDAISGEL
ncbi:hypothetical protein [Jiangella asiatica]|uniref:Uncharacterized protein n=1 Tax=Jiangella asiatica TaxID=2530372 RepID=A0A4R5CLF0_9ACTN|nr:hypothetical protein [Jiangella asiatica]TDE01179.1 hypothetical protein E1269_23740 [Jiangella asiatica]